MFQNPPSEYRSAPLWVWNDDVTTTQIEEQLKEFNEKGIGGVFIHPRPGLITPYLSEEWLSLYHHTVITAKKLGMKVWIYDENSYPSGFAGGHVPDQMPDAVRKSLVMKKVYSFPESLENEPFLVLHKTSQGFTDVTTTVQNVVSIPGEYYIFEFGEQAPSPWYGGFTYVDIMRKEVTQKFLQVTMDAYKKVIGNEFGETVLLDWGLAKVKDEETHDDCRADRSPGADRSSLGPGTQRSTPGSSASGGWKRQSCRRKGPCCTR